MDELIGKIFWFTAKVSRKNGAEFVLLEDIKYVDTTVKSSHLKHIIGTQFRDDNHCWVRNTRKWNNVPSVNPNDDSPLVCVKFKGKVNRYRRKPVIIMNGLPVYDADNFEENIEITSIDSQTLKIIKCQE